MFSVLYLFYGAMGDEITVTVGFVMLSGLAFLYVAVDTGYKLFKTIKNDISKDSRR